MKPISKEKAIKILHEKRISLFDINDAQKIFGIKNRNTLYKLVQRLEAAEVVERMVKGKYKFLFREVNDFELANFLVNPSYISLESALSFHGILPQFPYVVTSVTPLKPRKITYQDKTYEFSHLEQRYFFGFERKQTFLIASPEKAFLDQVYFVSKKLRGIHFEDLDLSRLDKKKLKGWSKKYKFLPFQKLIKKLKLL
jgi:predicted transcriptional regulator of viral defense system